MPQVSTGDVLGLLKRARGSILMELRDLASTMESEEHPWDRLSGGVSSREPGHKTE